MAGLSQPLLELGERPAVQLVPRGWWFCFTVELRGFPRPPVQLLWVSAPRGGGGSPRVARQP